MMTFPSRCFLMRLVPCCLILTCLKCDIDTKVIILHMKLFWNRAATSSPWHLVDGAAVSVNNCFVLSLAAVPLSACSWPLSSELLLEQWMLLSCFATEVSHDWFSMACIILWNCLCSFVTGLQCWWRLFQSREKVGQSRNCLVPR